MAEAAGGVAAGEVAEAAGGVVEPADRVAEAAGGVAEPVGGIAEPAGGMVERVSDSGLDVGKSIASSSGKPSKSVQAGEKGGVQNSWTV